MVLLVGVLHVFSLSGFIRPISARMSASSLSGRTSASAVFARLSLAPPPIHLLMVWRVVSLSVRYSRFSLSGCAYKHSRRATTSGRLELIPSSSRPTLCDCFDLCSCILAGVRGSSFSHFNEFRFQKPVPIESDLTSHDPSPVVHAPSN